MRHGARIPTRANGYYSYAPGVAPWLSLAARFSPVPPQISPQIDAIEVLPSSTASSSLPLLALAPPRLEGSTWDRALTLPPGPGPAGAGAAGPGLDARGPAPPLQVRHPGPGMVREWEWELVPAGGGAGQRGRGGAWVGWAGDWTRKRCAP